MTATVTIERFHAPTVDLDAVHAVIERDGAVILEGLLSAEVVARINDEVGAVLDAADPEAELFNPIMKAFHGPRTKQVAGVCGLSPTFATEGMCHSLLLALCDRILLPSCARYQLNLGHLLQRGPGADEQLLHRDELVWSDVPRPAPELQLATVIALVDFTRENGGTRIVPGSHRWPDRDLSPAEQFAHARPTAEQIAVAEMPAGSAVVYTGGTIHAGGSNTTKIPRRGAHLSYCLGWLRTEEDNYLRSEMPAGSAVVYTGGTIHAGGSNTTKIPRRGAHLSYCLGWLRTEENNYLAIP